MKTLIASHEDVVRLLPMAGCIDLMAGALTDLANGNALLPLRQVLRLPGGRNAFASMPAVLGDALGAKVITVFPGNEGGPWDSHIGVVLYFEDEHGLLRAIIDASSVTAIRTAAVSGVATRLLAREDASDLAVLGSGVQARTHVEAMRCVRPVRRVRVWSRTAAHADAFAGWVRRRFSVEAVATASAEDAVRGADLVCTTTSSRTPVLHGEWLERGAHVNAVGASLPSARELDTEAVARSRLWVDRRESAMNEAGDFLVPREEGAIDNAHIVGELGEVLTGRAGGRGSADEITLFKSLGIAVEDVASARYVYERARETGSGTWLAIGGLRPADDEPEVRAPLT